MLHTAEIRPRYGGHGDRPIGALIALQNRDHQARQRQAGTIQRMHELRLRASRRPVANERPAGLEVAEVRARADFEPFGAARGPDFDVELHGGDDAQVPRTHLYDPMPQAEPPAHALRVVDQAFELGIGGLWSDELDHFDLVELVAALDAAHVTPRRHALAPETGRIGDVVDWQPARFADFVAVHVC